MRLPRAIALALLAATLSLAQTKQAMDEEYARLVKEWTTAPEFMSPLVDHLPKAQGVPTTKDVLGYYAGAPKKLTRVADLGKYYRALAAASKRVKLLPAGTNPEPGVIYEFHYAAKDPRVLEAYIGTPDAELEGAH